MIHFMRFWLKIVKIRLYRYIMIGLENSIAQENRGILWILVALSFWFDDIWNYVLLKPGLPVCSYNFSFTASIFKTMSDSSDSDDHSDFGDSSEEEEREEDSLKQVSGPKGGDIQ